MLARSAFSFVKTVPALALALFLAAAGCGPKSTDSGNGENTDDACQDGVDNDSDGLTDCEDDECTSLSVCSGGDGNVPDSSVRDGSTGDGGDGGFEECATAEGVATNVVLPVDIIWAIDTSGSMDQETEEVENYVDDFSAFIAQSGLDYHVILVADSDVCFPQPPAGPNCSDSATFRHVKMKVDSNDAFEVIIAAYPSFQDFMRPNAKVSFVLVTDDNSDESWQWFDGQLGQLTNPGFPNGYTFHCIVAQGGMPFIGCCGWQGCGAAIGEEYIDLANQTGGIDESICNDDWLGIFTAIANNVMTDTVLPCVYEIPDPGGGQQIHPDQVNVVFTPDGGGQPWTIRNVPDASLCGNDGWYYDDPVNPTQVILCPETCAGLSEGELKIVFGCATVVD